MSDSGAAASSTGSPTTSAPAAIVALRSPPKVSRRFEPGTSAGPELRRPTAAAPMASGRVPYALEMRTRSRLPPRLTRGIIRSVWLLKAAPSAGAGAVVQVPTQCVMEPPGKRTDRAIILADHDPALRHPDPVDEHDGRDRVPALAGRLPGPRRAPQVERRGVLPEPATR